jgi:hypothetical protein
MERETRGYGVKRKGEKIDGVEGVEKDGINRAGIAFWRDKRFKV